MQKFRFDPLKQETGYPIIADNSETVAVADALYVDSNGHLSVVSTSSKVLGYSNEDKTVDSDNETCCLLNIV